MAVLKYKDQQGNWQTLDTGSGSVSSVEITSLPYGSEPTARISAGTLYIGWPDGVPVDSVITEESDNPVTSAAIYQALQDTPGMAPVQSVNGQTGAVVLDAQDVGAYEKPATGIPASDLADGVIPAVPVTDVQINGSSILNQGVANVPVAGNQNLGLVIPAANYGLGILPSNGYLYVINGNDSEIKSGVNQFHPVVPLKQHAATFYGLAKAAGDATQSASSNPVGTYTDAAKSAIHTMLNGSVSVSGTTPAITALPGIRYVCGEVATLDITLPASGIVDVVFESGSTATVLTITPPTGVTVKWANGFDPTALETNTTYEINIADGLGVAGSWT